MSDRKIIILAFSLLLAIPAAFLHLASEDKDKGLDPQDDVIWNEDTETSSEGKSKSKEVSDLEFSVEENNLNKSMLSDIADDRQKLEKRIPPKIVAHKTWETILNFSIPPEKLIEACRDQPVTLKETIISALPYLHSCLSGDYCGMSPLKDDPYFDPNNTLAHNLMDRMLRALLLIEQSEPGTVKDLRADDLFGHLEVDNDNVRIAAVKLILSKDQSEKTIRKLLSSVEKMEGSEDIQGNIYALLDDMTKQKENLRNDYIRSLSSALSSNNHHKVISILEKLSTLDLTLDELVTISKNPCKMEKVSSLEHNWKAVRFYLSKYARQRKLSTSIEEICIF